jgi:TRAP-type transport system periplasmic protein
MSAFRTLLLAHHATEDHATQLAVSQFSENVTERTEGQLNIAIMANSTLGSLPALIRMVIDGTADMALPPHDRISTWCPKFGCVSLPFIFDDFEHADRVLDGEFRAWATPELEASGLSLLASWEWGFRQITNSRRRIRQPADLQGLKIRVPPVLNCQAVMRALGAMPVVVEYAQLIGVLKQGMIDGQENPVSVIYALHLNQWQRYLSLINYNYGTAVHIINKKTLESLPLAQQLIVQEESQRAGVLMRRTIRAQEAAQLEALAELGMEIDRPDIAPFKAAMGPAYARLSEVYGRENVADFRSMVEHCKSAA